MLLRYTQFSSRMAALFSHENTLHTAWFAHPHELTSLLSPILDGAHLLLGAYQFNQVLRVASTRDRQELGNVLICGPTRSRKTLLQVAQLLARKGPAVVNDPKEGELFEKTAGIQSQRWQHHLCP